MVKEEKQIMEVRKTLIQLLKDTQAGKKEFPNSILVFGILSFVTLKNER